MKELNNIIDECSANLCASGYTAIGDCRVQSSDNDFIQLTGKYADKLWCPTCVMRLVNRNRLADDFCMTSRMASVIDPLGEATYNGNTVSFTAPNGPVNFVGSRNLLVLVMSKIAVTALSSRYPVLFGIVYRAIKLLRSYGIGASITEF